MALVYRVFSPNVLYVRLMSLAFGVSTCGLVYVIGRELGGGVVGLASCFVAALYQQLVFYSIVPLKTSLSVFCLAACAALLLRLLREDGAGNRGARTAILESSALGVLAGLMIHVRGNYVALVPVLAVFAFLGPKSARLSWKRRAFALASFVLGLVLAVSPVAIRNYRAAGQVALTTAQTGRNLYFGNNPDNGTPYYQPVRFASSVPAEQAVQFVIEASRRAGKRLSQEEASAFWTREVVRRAEAQPAVFVERLSVKALALLNGFESSDHYHVGFLSRFVRIFELPFLELWLVLPFGLLGMIALGRRSRGHAALVFIFLTYGATLVASVVNARYRLPLVVILIPFAVSGTLHAVRAIAERRVGEAVALSACAVLFAAIELLPLPGVGDLSGYASTHASLLDARGDTAEALRMWEDASRMGGVYSKVANLYLSGKAAERGDMGAAFRWVEAIPDASFSASPKYALLGDLYQAQGDARAAIEAYEKSLSINSGQRRVRKELIRLYARTAPEKVAPARRELARIESFFGLE
jgi:4-amino-4-deoxy-L-arabinose transferase-like glycosyltransferase